MTENAVENFTPDAIHWMREALKEAELSAAIGEVPVGAVVVHNGQVIGRGHNRMETSKDATAHAEVMAIRQASETLGTWRLKGAALYVTLEPCTMCIGAILLSRLDEIYFGCSDSVQGAAGSVYDLSSHPHLPSSVEVFSGVLADESRSLLRTFFAQRRAASESTLTETHFHK